MVKIAICDTETTGLVEPLPCPLKHQPYIIEVCICVLNGKKEKWFNQLIKPPVPIPHYITRITGISDMDVASAPTFEEAAKKIKKMFKGTSLFVGHNARFDHDMLGFEFERCGIKSNIPKKMYCTVEQSFGFFGYRPKLLEIYSMITGEREIKDQHRADADVKATIEVYKALQEGWRP